MNIIDAMKRLERAGDENSKATQKLHEAAHAAMEFIAVNVPLNVTLPRGYRIFPVFSRISGTGHSIRAEALGKFYHPSESASWHDVKFWISGTGKFRYADLSDKLPCDDRLSTQEFAKDIAEGLLDEIAVFLEKRKAESEQTAAVLQQASAQPAQS